MKDEIEFVARTFAVGVGATLVMDVWGALLRRAGVPSLSFALLGRWIGHLPEGRWIHSPIAKSAPVAHERLIGWCAHYAIGLTFAALLLATFGLKWGRAPSLVPALVVGVATVVAPLFVLQPALGAGIASSKTAAPVMSSIKSLITHTVYGVGMYLAALVSASLIPAGK